MAMKMRLFLNLGAVACLAVLLTACAEVPFMELKAAQAARDEARDLAMLYAPDEWSRALQFYDDARTAIEEQSGKSGMTRSYGEAKKLLDQAQQGFEQALESAVAKRRQLKTEAEEKSVAAQAALEETREALQGVRRTSRNRANRQRWMTNLDQLTYTLEDAQGFLNSEMYVEATQYLDTVLGELETMKTEIAGT
jgi:hypothetical protein